MIKIMRRLIIVWFIFFSLFTNSVSAQELPNLTLRCLNPTNIGKTKTQHLVQLDGSGFLPQTPVEIWRQTEEGFVCAIDKNGTSLCNSQALSANNNGEDFQILNLSKEQIMADSNGQVHIDKVRSRTKKRLNHFFYGAQKTAPSLSESKTPELIGTDYSLKLMTFLKQQQEVAAPELTNCVSVFFDPYGRVFDALSLEPIPQVAVWLLDSARNAIANQPGITNPNQTGEDGSFSFFVPDGTYYLSPKSQTHTFPVSAETINKLKQEQTIYTDLYASEPIIQQGEIQHRDVPLMPKNPNQPGQYLPVITDKTITEVWENNTLFQKITGAVSHPKAQINAFSGTRQVASTVADNQGSFSLLIENSLVEQTLPLDLVAEKVSLIDTTVLGTQTANLSEKVSLYPKPNYLVGYLYNKQAQVLPKTTVNILLPQMNQAVFAVAQTDNYGLLTVSQSLLPPVDYQLQFVSNNQTEQQTAFEFIKNNQTFLEKEKLNLLAPDEQTLGRIMEQKPNQAKAMAEEYAQLKITPTPTLNPKTESGSNLLYVILTLVTTTAIGVLIVALNRYHQKVYR